MLIIPIKEGENIDRALKRFKRKFDKTGGMRQLRSRKAVCKTFCQEQSKNSESTIHPKIERLRSSLILIVA